MIKSLLFTLILSLSCSLLATAQKPTKVPLSCARTGLLLSDQDQETVKVIKKGKWLTALYLCPDQADKANYPDSPLVPALMLETTPTLSVKTAQGGKIVRKLKKGDVLYRYEADTRQLTVWRVGIVHRKARRVSASHSLAIVGGGSFTEDRIALKE